jgi:hypothetical protein
MQPAICVERRLIDYKAVNFWNVEPEWEISALCRSGLRFAVVQDEGSGLLWASLQRVAKAETGSES